MSASAAGEWCVCIISAAYSENEEGVVIELYGRTDTAKSITIRYENFQPYFYIVEPSEELLSKLKSDEKVVAVKDCKLFYKGEMKNCVKVTTKLLRHSTEYRRKLSDYTTLAGDIPFYHRFMYDFDLGSCVKVVGRFAPKNIASKYTTELVVNAEKFEPTKPFHPALKILAFDLENSMEDGRVFTICCVYKENGSFKKAQFEGDERKIISDFVNLVQTQDPDVITGYNIDGYDIPLLKERIQKLKIEDLNIGRDFSAIHPMGDRFWRARGRIVADAWWNAKNELRPKQESLNYIAKLVLNEEKTDVDRLRIDREWSVNKQKVIDYCTKDAELSYRILEKIGVLEKAVDLAAVAKLPVDDIINGRTSTMIDSILIRAADRNNIGVPNTKRFEKVQKIVGGYVHSINPGLYHWVCVADFKSMYPSIIISKNICLTTLSKDGEIVSPTNVRFLSKRQKEGLLPKILESLMKDRENAKKLMKTAKTPEEKRYYDGLQFAIKTLMNAFYGVFASAFYRFTDTKIGESITAFGRENIKNVIDTLTKEGITVIYSDTDSVFFQSPYNNLEDTIKFGNQIASRFSKEGIVLEFDSVLEPFFSHGKKKRYVGNVIWPKEELLVRGYETRRTDAFDFQSEALAQIFEKALADDADNLIKTARKLVADVLEGNVPIEKLVISRTCKDYSDYKDPDSLAHVQTAKKLVQLGYEFVPGMKVSWVVTNAQTTPQQVEPYVKGRKFTAKPDYQYYASRVASTIARVTEVFGIDEGDLLPSLAKPGKQKKIVPPVKKGVTLDDFM